MKLYKLIGFLFLFGISFSACVVVDANSLTNTTFNISSIDCLNITNGNASTIINVNPPPQISVSLSPNQTISNSTGVFSCSASSVVPPYCGLQLNITPNNQTQFFYNITSDYMIIVQPQTPSQIIQNVSSCPALSTTIYANSTQTVNNQTITCITNNSATQECNVTVQTCDATSLTMYANSTQTVNNATIACLANYPPLSLSFIPTEAVQTYTNGGLGISIGACPHWVTGSYILDPAQVMDINGLKFTCKNQTSWAFRIFNISDQNLNNETRYLPMQFDVNTIDSYDVLTAVKEANYTKLQQAKAENLQNTISAMNSHAIDLQGNVSSSAKELAQCKDDMGSGQAIFYGAIFVLSFLGIALLVLMFAAKLIKKTAEPAISAATKLIIPSKKPQSDEPPLDEPEEDRLMTYEEYSSMYPDVKDETVLSGRYGQYKRHWMKKRQEGAE